MPAKCHYIIINYVWILLSFPFCIAYIVLNSNRLLCVDIKLHVHVYYTIVHVHVHIKSLNIIVSSLWMSTEFSCKQSTLPYALVDSLIITSSIPYVHYLMYNVRVHHSEQTIAVAYIEYLFTFTAIAVVS